MVTLNSLPVPAARSQPIYHPLAESPIEAEEQLMIRVQQRSIAALETLYDRYAETGMDLAFRILGDQGLAQQVLVEAFWQVWGHPHQYQWAHGSFSDLFSGIIWHLSMGELERRAIGPLPQTGDAHDRREVQHQQQFSNG